MGVQGEVNALLEGMVAGLARGLPAGNRAVEDVGGETARGDDAEADRRPEADPVDVREEVGGAAAGYRRDVVSRARSGGGDVDVDVDRRQVAGGSGVVADAFFGAGGLDQLGELGAGEEAFDFPFAEDRAVFARFVVAGFEQEFDLGHFGPQRQLIGDDEVFAAALVADVSHLQGEDPFAAGLKDGVAPARFDLIGWGGEGPRGDGEQDEQRADQQSALHLPPPLPARWWAAFLPA